MAYHHMSEYRDGTLGALMRQPGSVHEGSLGVLMRQPGSVHEGSLGVLMRQPGSVHEGSLGVLMRQPGSVHEGSLGVLMRQPGSVHEGSLGVLPRRRIYTAASPYLQGLGIEAMKPPAGPTTTMMAAMPGIPAAARAAMQRAQALAVCQARCGRLPPIGRASCRSACSAQYATHGLGLEPLPTAPPGTMVSMGPARAGMPQSARRAMERARARAECQSRCYAFPTAQRPACLTACSRAYPLSGLGGVAEDAAAAAREAAEHATIRVTSEQAAEAATTRATQAATQAAAATHPTERAAAQSAAAAASAEAAEHARRAQFARDAEMSAAVRARMLFKPVRRRRYMPWMIALKPHERAAAIAARAVAARPGQSVAPAAIAARAVAARPGQSVAPAAVAMRAVVGIPAGKAAKGAERRKIARRHRHGLPFAAQFISGGRAIYHGGAAVTHYAETPLRAVKKVPVIGVPVKAAETIVKAPFKAITSLFGLGAAPTASDIAAKMAAATARGTCLKSCEGQPGVRFGGCVSGCLQRYPLHGLGAEMTTTNWLWLAGGVALLGAVVFVATR